MHGAMFASSKSICPRKYGPTPVASCRRLQGPNASPSHALGMLVALLWSHCTMMAVWRAGRDGQVGILSGWPGVTKDSLGVASHAARASCLESEPKGVPGV